MTELSDLVRVIKRGTDVKRIVDEAIDQCDQFLNVSSILVVTIAFLLSCFESSAPRID